MKSDAIVVRSPRLYSGWYSLETDYGYWFCLDDLKKFTEIPEAKWYWVEASTRQWDDRSGIPVDVRIYPPDGDWYESADAAYWDREDKGWFILESTVIPKLKKLGVEVDGKPKRIFFRLLYEE